MDKIFNKPTDLNINSTIKEENLSISILAPPPINFQVVYLDSSDVNNTNNLTNINVGDKIDEVIVPEAFNHNSDEVENNSEAIIAKSKIEDATINEQENILIEEVKEKYVPSYSKNMIQDIGRENYKILDGKKNIINEESNDCVECLGKCTIF